MPPKILNMLTIFQERSLTMMAKPMKILELHYPMIQFLIMTIVSPCLKTKYMHNH